MWSILGGCVVTVLVTVLIYAAFRRVTRPAVDLSEAPVSAGPIDRIDIRLRHIEIRLEAMEGFYVRGLSDETRSAISDAAKTATLEVLAAAEKSLFHLSRRLETAISSYDTLRLLQDVATARKTKKSALLDR